MNNKIEYVVVIIGANLNEDLPVYPFTDYTKAVAFLNKTWKNDLDAELAINESIDMENTYCHEDNAKLTWADGSCVNYVLTYPGDVDMEA